MYSFGLLSSVKKAPVFSLSQVVVLQGNKIMEAILEGVK